VKGKNNNNNNNRRQYITLHPVVWIEGAVLIALVMLGSMLCYTTPRIESCSVLFCSVLLILCYYSNGRTEREGTTVTTTTYWFESINYLTIIRFDSIRFYFQQGGRHIIIINTNRFACFLNTTIRCTVLYKRYTVP
jgi:hypothetical protein